MNKFTKLGVVFGAAGMLLIPALSYAQSSESAVTTTIGYFYSTSEQMVDGEDNNGVMSSYLTRGERYNGTSETFAVSNIKDITADLDSNGNVLNKYTYTAYGTQTSYSSSPTINKQQPTNDSITLSTNPFTYDDYYTDRESGNYYLNARYYDPTLGIFLTSDSYNLPNRYMYVNGNPVMATDPAGHIEVNIEDLLKTHTVTAKFDGKETKFKNKEEWDTFAKEKKLADFKFDFSGENVENLNNATFTFARNDKGYAPIERKETYSDKGAVISKWNADTWISASSNIIKINKNEKESQFLFFNNNKEALNESFHSAILDDYKGENKVFFNLLHEKEINFVKLNFEFSELDQESKTAINNNLNNNEFVNSLKKQKSKILTLNMLLNKEINL